MHNNRNNKYSIVVIDYGMGNIRSILRKINMAGHTGIVSGDLNEIRSADKLILPGVGHFAKGMTNLRKNDLINILNEKVLINKTPILGICLGMQLLTKFSEEGNTEGLGWIDAETLKFNFTDIRHKIPHMGWNSVTKKKESPLLKNLSNDCCFYFVHSYYVKCHTEEDILTTTSYCNEFVSSIQKGNIFGTQFHPEKSHDCGELMLKNFLNL